MKKYLILILAVIGFPVLSHAGTSLGSYAVTTNTSIVSTGPVQISGSSSFAACSAVNICNTTGANGSLVRIQQLTTSPGSCATCGGINTGWVLYPIATSGATCYSVVAKPAISTGKVTPINGTQFYGKATVGTVTQSVSMSCEK